MVFEVVSVSVGLSIVMKQNKFTCTFHVSKLVIRSGTRCQGYFLIFQCLLNISEVPQFPHFVTLIVIRYHTDNQHLITLMTPETWTKIMYSSFPNKLGG